LLRYDERELVKALERLPRQSRIAFGTACAERLLPAYERFSERTNRGEPKALASILERLWRALRGAAMSAEEVKESLNLGMALIPQEDEGPWVVEQASAEDAAASVMYALRCWQSGASEEAAWAARRAYEAADHYVINRENIDTNGAGGETRVLSHPIVQAELIRQRRDLDELRAAGAAAGIELIDRFCARAKVEAKDFFPLGS
jgi:uncharacterized protein YjaG (DUF416 family)